MVDTPGVGIHEEMTNKLLDYMQEAVAFIYVINTPNGGGVQNDRVQFSLRMVVLVNVLITKVLNSGFWSKINPTSPPSSQYKSKMKQPA